MTEISKSVAESILKEMRAYDTGFLVERLLKQCIVDDERKASELISELFKFLIISDVFSESIWDMHSLKIDEVWHQFILYTQSYLHFCRKFFGHYVHHGPNNAPELNLQTKLVERQKPTDFADFVRAYEELFSTYLPQVWFDWENITPNTRLTQKRLSEVEIRYENDEIVFFHSVDGQIMSVGEVATTEVQFMTQHRSFYVRELSGQLNHDEACFLISMMVKNGLVSLAA